MALIVVYVDKRANDPKDKYELMSTLGVAFVTVLDIARTYPDDVIMPPAELGFCDDTGGGCKNFRRMAKPVEGGETHSFIEGLRGPIVSAFAICQGPVSP